MFGYTMEQFEILGDAMEEITEWETYEKDIESNPWGEDFSEPDEFYFEGMYGEL